MFKGRSFGNTWFPRVVVLDPILQEILRGPSVGIAPNILRYRVSYLTHSRSTAAVMVTLFAVCHSDRGVPVFTSTVGVSLHVLRRRCSSRRKTSAFA